MDEIEEIRARKLSELESYLKDRSLRETAKPVHLTEATFDAEAGKAGLLLVDMWAAWCGPCLRIAPMIEELAKDYAGRVRVGKLNVDENPGIAGRFGVESIPTLLLFKDGDLVEAIVGAVSKPQIQRVLERWL